MNIPAWQDGVLTPLDKMLVHREGLQHPAVSVFVMDGAHTLIQRRAAGKYHTPGLWANSCCTHPDWGEAPADCAHRRLWQELGIEGLACTPRAQVSYRAEVPPDLIENEIVDIFVAQADAATLRIAPDPEEVSDYRWLSLPELRAEIAATPERFTPWLRIYLDRHAGQVFAGLE